jgi:hypothetical protein
MDYLKLIGKTEEELQERLQGVKTCSFIIDMEFWFHKCAEIVLKKGKLVYSRNLIIYVIIREIQEFEQGKT